MGTFLRCMERCLRFNTGTTLVDIFDNMKTVVLSHTATATVFNPKFLEYAGARGFAVRACNVRKANEKGRVERPIGFVRRRFWPGRRVSDLLDLNAQAARFVPQARRLRLWVAARPASAARQSLPRVKTSPRKGRRRTEACWKLPAVSSRAGGN